MNVFGDIFKVTIWGESHGEAIGITLGGVPAGIALSAEDFDTDLKRRQSGERDLRLRLRADVSVDDDGCRLLRCRVVIMRGTRSLLTAHFPPDVSVCVCVCACMRVCVCVCVCCTAVEREILK